jgi:phage terminase small subunit
MALNQKRRRFCQEYRIDGNGTRSAKAAGYSSKTAYSIANVLLNKDEVQAEIERLQALDAKRSEITVDRINDMLIEDRDVANRLEKPSAMVAASMGLARVNGHINEGQATVNVNVGLGGLLKDLEDRRIKDVTPDQPKLAHQDASMPVLDIPQPKSIDDDSTP